MSGLRIGAAFVAGLALAALPFLRYAPLGASAAAHVDHEPRHGGLLGMAGDHHVELCRRRGRIEAFVSDARRRPIRPREGRIVVDGIRTTTLAWQDHRLVGPDAPGAGRLGVEVVLDGGERVSVEFDVEGTVR